jgi:cytoskeletal protein CcmA (bactofilin family)
MIFKFFPFAFVLSSVVGDPASLRGAAGSDELLSILLQKIESLETRMDEQERDFDKKLESHRMELSERITLISKTGSRALATSDDECYFSYDSNTDSCSFSKTADFGSGLMAHGDISFNGTVVMMDGAHVKGSPFQVDSSAQFTKGLEVSNGATILLGNTSIMGGMEVMGGTSMFVNNTVTMDKGLEVDGRSTFEGSVDFNDHVDLTGSVEFNNAVDFKGSGPVIFSVEVTFKDEDVTFEKGAEVEFKDDVEIDGGSDSDESIDFDIKGYVKVDFMQKEPFDVFTETRFRDDVLIKKEEKKNTGKTGKTGKSSKSSEDDPEPTLHVAGDITTEMSLHAGENLHVDGDGEIGGVLTVGGPITTDDLTVNGPITAQSSTITGDQTVQGNLDVTGTAEMGATTVNGALDATGAGTFDSVSAGAGTFSGVEVTTDGASITGDVDVDGQVFADAFIDCDPIPVIGCPGFVPP